MKIRILGAGWYGCHIAAALLCDGHDIEILETRNRIFDGASGRIPARLHIGAHYPRSHKTRAACQRHTKEFLRAYGFLTRGVPINLYAIAKDHSLVDFQQYTATLRDEFEFITVHDPWEFGLQNVEGAILTGERHILAEKARAHFERELAGRLRLGAQPGVENRSDVDLTVDCTFCANDSAGVDRYEPCLVLMLDGPTDRAVTIMDGPFGSLYPWDEEAGLSSLSSARWTPFSKDLKTYRDARAFLDHVTESEVCQQGIQMYRQMRHFYPAIENYRVVDRLLSIRAMPLSGADSRLVDVRQVEPGLLRVRAGKIDAVLEAERKVREFI